MKISSKSKEIWKFTDLIRIIIVLQMILTPKGPWKDRLLILLLPFIFIFCSPCSTVNCLSRWMCTATLKY